MKKLISTAFMAILAAGGFVSLGGNIPQYKLEQKVVKQDLDKKQFAYLEGATAVKSNWDNAYVSFADGTITNSAYKGKGFEIGFPFRFGGRVFTHFAIDNTGVIYLGDADGVDYHGGSHMLFQRPAANWEQETNNFYFGCNYPVPETEIAAYKGGEIFYKGEGAEGSRTMTVEIKNIRMPDQKGEYIGLFDLHLVMHENGTFDVIINELETTSSTNKFFVVGARGWDIQDAMLLTGSSIINPVTISPQRVYHLLEKNTFVAWDAEDYDNYAMVRYSFIPESNTSAPKATPTELQALQSGTNMQITCKKAAGSDATLVLFSETPFTAAEYPEQGVTYAGADWLGAYPCSIGNATVIYSGDDENIDVTLTGMKRDTNYYIMAISANGYPAYNIDDAALLVSGTTQAGVKSIEASTLDAENIRLEWEAENNVIIAATTVCNRNYNSEYRGLFGTPSVDAEVGDEIPGGGVVVYVGDGNKTDIAALELNKMNYFAAWTVKEGRLSTEIAYAHGVTKASIPYEPALETYPGWTTPEVISSPTPDVYHLVDTRLNEGPAFRASLIEGSTNEFHLPEIEHNVIQGLELEFDFALETDRGFESVGGADGGVQIKLGNGPGWFGETGSMDILLNGSSIESIKEYNGSMDSNGDNGFISGTSTWESKSISIPTRADNKYTIGFRAKTEKTSELYIKAIKITDGQSKVGEIIPTDNGLSVYAAKGLLRLSASEAVATSIYNVAGVCVANVELKAGESADLNLAAGIYVVNGRKVVVK